MRESKFIEQNREKWERFEILLKSDNRDPDRLSSFFVQITDDLSYARTFYNNRTIRVYLNNLCQQLFYVIYRAPKRRYTKSFWHFWREGLPVIAYQSRRELLISLCVFLIAMAIGVVSSHQDPEFVRVILGDDYVDMTVANITSGDPMAVYKKSNEFDMFLSITFNNLLVAVRTFLMGIVYAVGSIIILLYNGIMVGAFQYFFIEQDLFRESFLTIWLHGTLEISSIVIAGASGIVLGKGIIAPGSYSRLQAFQIAAKRGAMLFLGIVPILIFAAIIESFLTRYTDVSDVLRLLLILVSLAFMLFYFVFYPRVIARRRPVDTPVELQPTPDFTIRYEGLIKSAGDILRDTFLFYRKHSKQILLTAVAVVAAYTVLGLIVVFKDLPAYIGAGLDGWFEASSYYGDYSTYPILFLTNSLVYAVFSTLIFRILLRDIDPSSFPSRARWAIFLLIAFFSNCLVNAVDFASSGLAFFTSIIFQPMVILMLFVIVKERVGVNKSITRVRLLLKGNYGFVYGVMIIVTLIGGLIFFFFNTPFPFLYLEFIKWNIPTDEGAMRYVLVFVNAFIPFFTNMAAAPITLVALSICYFSLLEIVEARDLRRQLKEFMSK